MIRTSACSPVDRAPSSACLPAIPSGSGRPCELYARLKTWHLSCKIQVYVESRSSSTTRSGGMYMAAFSGGRDVERSGYDFRHERRRHRDRRHESFRFCRGDPLRRIVMQDEPAAVVEYVDHAVFDVDTVRAVRIRGPSFGTVINRFVRYPTSCGSGLPVSIRLRGRS